MGPAKMAARMLLMGEILVALPLSIPFLPMEAKIASQIPVGSEWEYEPKWDGFRCLAFRDGDHVELQSKAGKPLTRYFPEVVASLLKADAASFVLDGELTVTVGGILSFDDLLQRIHPAASRVRTLAENTPARYVLFDLLVDNEGVDWTGQPLEARRAALEKFHDRFMARNKSFELSVRTRDPEAAREWLTNLHGQVDGVVAKRVDLPYLSGERAMIKVKNIRTADCVVGGFRYGSAGEEVGSLLLGLYDDEGLLTHVGFTSSMASAERKELTRKLRGLISPPGFDKNLPGGPSRWSTERSSQWEPVKPELVLEIQYDHFSGDRFRHGTKFLRWRPDKDPRQCTMKQLA